MSSNPFATAAMAAGYAQARPPLHERIVARAVELLHLRGRASVAVDLGCGSGLSTRPLVARSELTIGIEPAVDMLAWARTVAPGACFFAGSAEAIPLRSGSVDLMTAAGALNYTDPRTALLEIRRVLKPGGALCVYDFSQGRRFRSSNALAEWFAAFEKRYPIPPGEATPLSPEILAGIECGFEAGPSERFDFGLPMNAATYTEYIMTESNVAAAVRAGTEEQAVRKWVEETIAGIFSDSQKDVMFAGYLAWMQKS